MTFHLTKWLRFCVIITLVLSCILDPWKFIMIMDIRRMHERKLEFDSVLWNTIAVQDYCKYLTYSSYWYMTWLEFLEGYVRNVHVLENRNAPAFPMHPTSVCRSRTTKGTYVVHRTRTSKILFYNPCLNFKFLRKYQHSYSSQSLEKKWKRK